MTPESNNDDKVVMRRLFLLIGALLGFTVTLVVAVIAFF